MTTALEPYRQQAGDLDGEHATTVAALAEPDSFAVANDDDATFAADLIREVKSKHRQLDDRRKEVTGPLNQTVKTINGWFKPALEALETAERKLKAKVAGFVQERERQTREALAAVAAAADANEATKALAEAQTPAFLPQGMSARMVWRWRVADANAVPRSFCSPDAQRIENELRGALKDGNSPPTIAGIEFFQETQMAVRR